MKEDPRAAPMREIIAHQTLCRDTAEKIIGWTRPRGLADAAEDAVALCVAASRDLQAIFDRVERGADFGHFSAWMDLQCERIRQAIDLYGALLRDHTDAQPAA